MNKNFILFEKNNFPNARLWHISLRRSDLDSSSFPFLRLLLVAPAQVQLLQHFLIALHGVVVVVVCCCCGVVVGCVVVVVCCCMLWLVGMLLLWCVVVSGVLLLCVVVVVLFFVFECW